MAELEPRNFIQPCLLLLLHERPDHGYELASRLRPMHEGDGDAGGVYRALRGLERNGMVRSEWETSGAGPARRTYHVTTEGLTYLDEQAQVLERTHETLHVFLERYALVSGGSPPHADEEVTDDHNAHGRARGGVVRPQKRADSSTGH